MFQHREYPQIPFRGQHAMVEPLILGKIQRPSDASSWASPVTLLPQPNHATIVPLSSFQIKSISLYLRSHLRLAA